MKTRWPFGTTSGEEIVVISGRMEESDGERVRKN